MKNDYSSQIHRNPFQFPLLPDTGKEDELSSITTLDYCIFVAENCSPEPMSLPEVEKGKVDQSGSHMSEENRNKHINNTYSILTFVLNTWVKDK